MLGVISVSAQVEYAGEALEAHFAGPPVEFGPRTWWHWLDDHVTEYGITKDLEAMKRIGLKGAHITNIPGSGPGVPTGDDYILSPSWFKAVEHAARECERLGLTLGMSSAAGCSGSGGPWVTAEQSMQELVWRHHFVKGPVTGKLQLPQPQVNCGYYRDIAVLAFPTLPGEAVPVSVLRPKITSDLSGVDWAAAIDGDRETFVTLPRPPAGQERSHVVFEFRDPVRVRSLIMQFHEDSRNRVVTVFAGMDGRSWARLVTSRRWRGHFIPARELMVDGFQERDARFLKIEFMAAQPPVPMKLYELSFQSARLNQLHTKAARQRTRPQISNPSPQVVPDSQRIRLDTIVDLTDRLLPGGKLDCNLPEGEWTVLRFGHTSSGDEIGPATEKSKGLEVDKLSAKALEDHFRNGMVGQVFDRLGPLTGKVMVDINVDSWEAVCQTWTRKFPEEFSKRRSYDCRKWLPALTGRIVESVDLTERLLWDYRRTIGDLLVENFYGKLRELCNACGVKLEAEAPGIGIPCHADALQCLGVLDVPQGEFWLGDGTPDPRYPGWSGGQDNTKEAAAAAHVYGKEITSCEAFTSFGHHDGWTQYPFILKPVGDRQFCKGMNEIVFHRYAHQPDDRFPGRSLGQFGLNFERTLTWWEPGRAWIDYLSRCQFMLRQGRFFADVCYYYGEDVPGSAYYFVPNALDPRKQMKPVLPQGYDYDVCDRTTLDRMRVEDGMVVLPSGMRYAYLVLPESARYTPQALEKVHALVLAGATVIGPKPSRSPSLADYPRADARIRGLADQLWPPKAGPGERQVGKGRVIAGKAFETIFKEDGLPPDFRASFSSGEGKARYIHRRLPYGELYFVANQERRSDQVTLRFRTSGRIPEVWDPVSGERKDALLYHDDGTTTALSLCMTPFDSRFILFRRPSTGRDCVVELRKDGKRIRGLDGAVEERTDVHPELRGPGEGKGELVAWDSGSYEVVFRDGEPSTLTVAGLPGPETVPEQWTVSFQENRRAPAGQVAFERLVSWTERPEAGIRHFSGTATYEKGINVSRERLREGRRVYLDLGDVRHLAEVFVNDRPLGVLWKPPFRVDMTDAAVPGANKVQVKITNVCKNRLVGDAALPEESRVTWTSWPFYKSSDEPLVESGLLGPVRILSSESHPVD